PDGLMEWIGSEHVPWVEVDNYVCPRLVFFRWQIVGRAADDRAAGRFGRCTLDTARSAAGNDPRIAFDLAGLVELELHGDLEIAGVGRPGGHIPAALDLAAQRVHLALAQLCACGLATAKRCLLLGPLGPAAG